MQVLLSEIRDEFFFLFFLPLLAKENIVLLILLLIYRAAEKIVVQLVMLMVDDIAIRIRAKRIVPISGVCQSFEIIKPCSLRFEARRGYQRALISRSLDSRSTSMQYSFHGERRIRSINFVTSVCRTLTKNNIKKYRRSPQYVAYSKTYKDI